MYKNYTQGPGILAGYIHKFLLVMNLAGQTIPARRRKIIIRINLTTLVLIVAIVQVSAAAFAQKITLKEKNATLETVFKDLRKQSGYDFYFDQEEITKGRPVTINLKNTSLSEALSACLAGQPFSFIIDEKTVIIKQKDTSQPKVTAPLKVNNVSGIVKDTTGATLPGVSVVNQTAGGGIATDANGAFKINASPGDVLVFSFIGYLKRSVTVGTETQLSVILRIAPNQLSAVVVTALGIKRSTKSLTYNAQQLGGAEVNNVKDPSFINSIEGKIAGVTINASSSGIGGATRVVMRGAKSLFGNNNALFVIDGVPLPALAPANQPTNVYGGSGATGDGIANLNPDDIESMTVLTGAAASALYGSSAANGVVVITTKKGAAGKTEINYSNNTGFLSPLMMPKFQDEYGASSPGVFDNWGAIKLITPSSYKPAVFFQTGFTEDNALNVSTGTEKSQSYFSAASLNGRGIIPNNELERYNFTARNTSNYLDGKLVLDINFMYVKQTDQNMLSQGAYFNPLVPVYLFPRTDNIANYQVYERYDPSRNFQTQYWPYGAGNLNLQNPFWIDNKNLFTNTNDRYLMGAQLRYNINSWLNIAARVKQDNNTNVSQQKLYASTSTVVSGPEGYYSDITNITKQTYADVLVNFNRDISSFNINGTLGASLQNTNYSSTGYNGNLLTVPNLFNFANINSQDPQHAVQAIQDGYMDAAQAVFGTASLSYKRLFFLDLSIRNDWSSALVNTTNKSIYYPSIGANAILSDLLRLNPSVVSFLKARASYSEVGNSPQRFISTPTYPLMGGSPVTQTAFAPSTLQPERTKSFETGINAKFLNNKISLDATYYNTNTYNQLFSLPSPLAYGGYSTIYVNAGKVNNKGLEIALGYNDKFGSLGVSSNVTFGLNRNKIVELVPSHIDPLTGARLSLDSALVSGTFVSGIQQIIKKGGSIGDLYANDFIRDYKGNVVVNPSTLQPETNTTDYTKVGNTNPAYNIGFRNNFTYKGFNFGFQVDGRFGGIVASGTQQVLDQTGSSVASAQARDAGGATLNGAIVKGVQSYYQVASTVGSLYVYSATNIRLRELTLGYTVPGTFFNNTIKSLRLGVYGRNLFFLYNHAPFDPEETANTGTFNQGMDYFMPPTLRNIGFSINAKL